MTIASHDNVIRLSGSCPAEDSETPCSACWPILPPKLTGKVARAPTRR